VFLVGVTPGGMAGLDAQLFLTEAWAADRQRRKKAGVPKQIKFLDALEAIGQRYLVEVKKNTLVWTVALATLPGKTPGPKMRKKLGSYRYREVRSAQEIAADLPADAWRPLKLHEGTKGPLVCEFAVLRVLPSRTKPHRPRVPP